MTNESREPENELPKVDLAEGRGMLYRLIAHEGEEMVRVVPQGDPMWLPKHWLDDESEEELEEAGPGAMIYVWSHGPEPWMARVLSSD